MSDATGTDADADPASPGHSRGRSPGRGGHRLPWRAIVATGLSLALFAGIAYGGWRLLHSPTERRAAVCPSPTATAAAVPAVAVRVLNGTARRGLAGSTADALRSRGFRIAGVGNGPRVPGRSQIRYGSREALAARLTALQLPASVLVADARVTARVDLVLGSAFRRLRTPAEVAAATRLARLSSPRPASRGPCR